MLSSDALCRVVLAVWALVLPAALAAQPPVGPPPQPATSSPVPGTPPVEYTSPYEAFDAGAYAQALDGFLDRQTERPDDPELNLNVGAAHYKLDDFAAADTQFYRAAATGDDELRAQALYNLGNSAYRQGKLGDAIDFYKASLEANSDDLDTKFNLEFVREELEKQEQQQNQSGQEQESQEGAAQRRQQSEDSDQGGGEQPEDRQDGEGSEDSDRDGLSDDLERSAENPTDPRNPDSDADGVPDGQEDRNRNGRVDPGETDPNRRDSDGDGIPDAADAPVGGDGSNPGNQDGFEQPPPGMTPEEAERLLQALEEGRLDPDRRGQRRRGNRQAKDW